MHVVSLEIARAASLIKDGGVVIYPTETFYALGGHPGQALAVERIYRIKRRDLGKPLPLIAADTASVRRIAAQWPREAAELAEAFWPGPLTIILVAAECILEGKGRNGRLVLCDQVHAHKGKIAVRVSSHPIAQELSSQVGGLLISTSANFSGEPPYVDLNRMPAPLLDFVDGVVDGGVLAGSRSSTIVDVTSRPPRLVRAGALAWDSVQTALTC